MLPTEKFGGRSLALAILAGLVAAILIFIVVPVAGLFAAQRSEIVQSKQMLSTYRAEMASRPRLEAELSTLNQHEASTAGLLHGASAALAAANMQSMVKALVESHGGQIRSVQNLPSTPLGGLEKIEVEYDFSLPLGSLKPVTYKLETATPYLFLSDADLKVSDGPQADGVPQNVDVHWTISGYRWAAAQ